MISIGVLTPKEYIKRRAVPYKKLLAELSATYANTEPRIGPTHGIQRTPRDIPRKRPPRSPSPGAIDPEFPGNDTCWRPTLIIELVMFIYA